MSIQEIAIGVNQLRVVPRILVAFYGILIYQTCLWFTSLPEPNNAQAAFSSAVIGAAAAFFKFYVDSGPTIPPPAPIPAPAPTPTVEAK